MFLEHFAKFYLNNQHIDFELDNTLAGTYGANAGVQPCGVCVVKDQYQVCTNPGSNPVGCIAQ